MHGILILWHMLINISDLSDLPPAISVTAQSVFRTFKAFPKGSYPGGFQLQTQHLLDAVSGFTAPVAQDCLHQITCLVNFLLSGKASPLAAPWLCGAPITALHKKNGGVHPRRNGGVQEERRRPRGMEE